MRRAIIPLFAMFLVGCGEPVEDTATGTHSGIQIGDEGSFGCNILSTTPVADADATIAELGLSANEAHAGQLGSFAGTATLHDATVLDPFALTLGPASAMDWVETALPDGTPDASCTSYLRLTLTVDVDGGATLGASVPSELSISASQQMLKGSVDIGQVVTTLDPLWVNPADMAWTDLVLLGFFGDGGWTGGLGFMGCTAGNECSPPISIDGPDAELVFDVGVSR